MSRALAALAAAAAATALCAAPARAAEPPDAPALHLTSLATPTAFVPNDPSGDYSYDLRIANLGAGPTDGSDVTVTDTLPAGLAVKSVAMRLLTQTGGAADYAPEACAVNEAGPRAVVSCTISDSLPQSREPAVIHPLEERRIEIEVAPGALGEGEALPNRLKAEGGGSPPAQVEVANEAASKDPGGGYRPAPPGLSFFNAALTGPDGRPASAAASHPYQFTLGFALNTNPPPPGSQAQFVPAGGGPKDITTTLPAGLSSGGVLTENRCPRQRFAAQRFILSPPGGFYEVSDCPPSAAVGVVLIQELEGAPGIGTVPLYNLVPPPGMPAQLGFQIAGAPLYIDTEVHPADGYRVTASLRNVSQLKAPVAATTVIWGDPADPRHDPLRGECLDQLEDRPRSRCELAAGAPERPFLRLPTGCAGPLEVGFGVGTWTGASFSALDSHPAPTGCGAVPFSPTLTARPSTDLADSPSGLEADLHIPQGEFEDPAGLNQADLRRTVVRLPEGLVINPSGANGLGACTEAEIGYLGKAGGQERFSDDPAACPDAAKIGTAEVRTPLLAHPLRGAVYVAEPHENPFDSLLAIYLALEDTAPRGDPEDPQTGLVVKLAGRVEPDPDTGRLTTSFEGTPQLPFEDFKLDFFGGPGAALRTPAACGPYSTDSVMTPWSAPAGGTVGYSEGFAIDRNPSAEPCPSSEGALPRAFAFNAGTEAPIAGAYSPLVMSLSRPDGTQELGRLTLSPPPGLLARLAGIPYCPEAALGAAAGRSGREEQASPSCPAASRVGSVTVGAGAGPEPYHTSGSAYLAGPYKGAPLSLAIITPALAGPYDIGTVVVRTALYVNPASAQITAISDPIPHILQGIPLDVRSVAVRLDRPGWGLNPTSCEPSLFGAGLFTKLGQPTVLASRFQVGECGRLGFKPRLNLRLFGKIRRGAFPRLRAVYVPRAGDANLRRLVLRFPRSEFIEQSHFRTICTRAAFAAGAGHGEACPPGSIYGHVRAFTPLLDSPLEGPVYLRSSSHNLPDVVFALNGQVSAEVAVRIDSVGGGLRATVESAPDVPVSRVVLNMRGAQKGLFVNSRNVCARKYRAHAGLRAHNGRARHLKPVIRNKRCAKWRREQRKRHRKQRGAKKPHAGRR